MSALEHLPAAHRKHDAAQVRDVDAWIVADKHEVCEFSWRDDAHVVAAGCGGGVLCRSADHFERRDTDFILQ